MLLHYIITFVLFIFVSKLAQPNECVSSIEGLKDKIFVIIKIYYSQFIFPNS